MSRIVVCTKWGTKYPGEDVNRLYRMVRKLLPGDLTFVCQTERPEDLLPEIVVQPLPDLPPLGTGADMGWRKLAMFASDFGGLRGDALFLDLDVVVVDDLTPLFEIEGDFRIIKDYRLIRRRHAYTGNSSVVRFKIGEHEGLLEMLQGLGERVRREFRNEQEFLSYYARERGILQYWPKEWCPSFKYHCVPKFPLNLFLPPRKPTGAKIVIFHGLPKPEDAVVGKGGRPRRFILPAPWLADYIEPS